VQVFAQRHRAVGAPVVADENGVWVPPTWWLGYPKEAMSSALPFPAALAKRVRSRPGLGCRCCYRVLATWSAAHGLTGADAFASSAPRGDGVPDLVKYAFNLAGNVPDITR